MRILLREVGSDLSAVTIHISAAHADFPSCSVRQTMVKS